MMSRVRSVEGLLFQFDVPSVSNEHRLEVTKCSLALCLWVLIWYRKGPSFLFIFLKYFILQIFVEKSL